MSITFGPSEADCRRAFMRYFAQSPEPVSWEFEMDGDVARVEAKLPTQLRNIMVRLNTTIGD